MQLTETSRESQLRRRIKELQRRVSELEQSLQEEKNDRKVSYFASRRDLQSIFKQTKLGMAMISADKNWVDMNDTLCEMLGYSREEMSKISWQALTYPEDVDSEMVRLDSVLVEGVSGYSMEKRFVRKDGSVLFANICASAILEDDNSIDYLIIMVHDDSEKIQAWEKQHESEITNQAILQAMPDFMFRLARDGMHLDFYSPGIDELYVAAEDIVGRTVTELLPQDVAGTYKHHIKAALEKRSLEVFEYDLVYPAGEIRPFEARMVPCGQDSVLTLVRNITERKRLENELHAKAERLELAMSVADDGLFDWDVPSGNIYFDPRYYTMAGHEPNEYPGRYEEWSKRVHPDDYKWLKPIVEAFVAGETKEYDQEFRLLQKDGDWMWVRSRFKIVEKNDKGESLRVVGTHSDITKRKKLELELSMINQAIENSLNAFNIINQEGKFVYVNKAYVDMWGYDSAQEVIGTSPLNHCADSNLPKQLINQLRKDGNSVFEFKAKRKDGSLFDALMCAHLYHDLDGSEIYSGTSIEITDRKFTEDQNKKLTEQLHQSQKMEAIGRLAGGVAHDFNNMLSVILGYAEMALDEMNGDGALKSRLQHIVRAAERSKEITLQLLAFARKQSITPYVLDLNESIAKMLKMIRRLIGEGIEVVWRPGSNLWPLKVDPSQLDQVLFNLCINSRDAILNVGKIIIETENVVLDQDFPINQQEFIRGEYIRISVSDNGSGMDKDTLSKVFEPFFTTKPLYKGTGLGLATVYGIVKQNNGFVSAYSELGRGTTFKIYFPRHYEGLEISKRESSVTQFVQAKHDEVVLLVEDEVPLLKLTKEMLEKLGHTVLDASTPSKAILLAKQYQDTIHVLVTDVVMPEMNGLELANRLLLARPDLKILFTSGYTTSVIEDHGLADKNITLIQKPFSLEELAGKIREVVDVK